MQHGIFRVIGGSHGISRIKLGPGVVGITGTAMVAATIVAGIVAGTLAFAGRADLILNALLLIFAFAIVFFIGTYLFAFLQPDLVVSA